MRFPKGETHPKWRGGLYETKDGYVVVSAGKHRGKYLHRLVSDGNLKKYWGRGLRKNEEVHHMDFNRSHNCPGNLLIIDERLHDAFSSNHASRVKRGWYEKPILEMAASVEKK